MATDTEQAAPPTLAAVRQAEQKANELRAKAAELEAHERELSRRIAAGLAADEDPSRLQAERREAKELLADYANALPLIRERNAVDRERACRAEAKKRLTAIARAHGSLRVELDADVDRLQKAAEAYADRVRKLNQRYVQLEQLAGERAALVERFDLEDAPTLPAVIAPAQRTDAAEAIAPVRGAAVLSKAPKGFGARFPDVPKDAPGAEILREAGPKPENDEERGVREPREALERRREERQAEQNRRFVEATRAHTPPGMSGRSPLGR